VYPTLGSIAGFAIPTHGVFVALGVFAAAAVLVVEARRRGQTDERILLLRVIWLARRGAYRLVPTEVGS
jgi:phosphatidylglycerol---prolipoprotein diacylglyceryl transferase